MLAVEEEGLTQEEVEKRTCSQQGGDRVLQMSQVVTFYL